MCSKVRPGRSQQAMIAGSTEDALLPHAVIARPGPLIIGPSFRPDRQSDADWAAPGRTGSAFPAGFEQIDQGRLRPRHGTLVRRSHPRLAASTS